ncbi:hypothetical protein NS220_16935 [Microbacterium testaceum]|uniref:HTH tetR-type domain-containing protein n=1 Tax=Microbacterium testaceum TaxID=2033 RepID=A0A147ESX0_MICTE|nr:TetR/AcrR family transcriptional regulator [Microbacterium testaceum]KTR87870.1 hypothetical protein NS220_16935 [Microbacterium testaceum]
MSEAPWRDIRAPEYGPILTAALEVFLEKGYHGASVREIAQRAGLTVPSLYYHHESKEGLLRDVLSTSLVPIADFLDIAAETGADAVERLANVVECLVYAMTVDARSAAIDAAEARYLSSAIRDQYVAVRDRIEDHVREVLRAGVAEGVFVIDDISETRRAMLGMIQTIPRWYRPDGKASPEEISRRYVRMVLRMVGTSPDRIR